MKAIYPALLLLVAATALAQEPLSPPSSPQEVPAYCQKRELQPTTLAVMGRDRGIPMQQFVDGFPVAQAGFLAMQLSVSRLNDVYENPRLNALTLAIFRSASCIEELARRSPPRYKPELREALVECQNISAGSVRDLAECVANASDANIIG